MTPIEMAEAMEGRARVRRKITNRENTGDRLSDQLEQAATMLRQQQAEIEAGKIMIKGYSKIIDEQQAEMDIVIKLLCGEQISDDLMAYWNPLHSTLKSKLLKAQENG